MDHGPTDILFCLSRKETVSICAPQMLTVVSIPGTMILPYSAMCACCSPAARRETPPAPPVTLLRYPAVNRLVQHPPLPHPPRHPLLLLLLRSVRVVLLGLLLLGDCEIECLEGGGYSLGFCVFCPPGSVDVGNGLSLLRRYY